jgi:hypothetical protein
MTSITWDEMSAAIRRDYLNVVPTLILLTAVDPCFPERSASVWRFMTADGGILRIDFDRMTQAYDTRSTLALVAMAHDIWNGGMETPLNDVLHRCDSGRLNCVVKAIATSAHRGRGRWADEMAEELEAALS